MAMCTEESLKKSKRSDLIRTVKILDSGYCDAQNSLDLTEVLLRDVQHKFFKAKAIAERSIHYGPAVDFLKPIGIGLSVVFCGLLAVGSIFTLILLLIAAPLWAKISVGAVFFVGFCKLIGHIAEEF